MTDLIRGKIARVLNSREVAINLGSGNGVKVGMHFDVLDKNSEDIMDPDTGALLGSIERAKVRVKITRVEEKLSLASTYRTRRINVGGSGLRFATSLSRALMPPEWITKYETFKTEEKSWEELGEEESYVKAGDTVVQVILDATSAEENE